MVTIGTVKSCGRAENYNFDFDDRQELVKTVNGAVAVDAWDGTRNNKGDVISFKALFTVGDGLLIRNYWTLRQKVDVTLDDGTVINNARIIVRQIEFESLFYRKYEKLAIEVWRV